MRDLPSRPLVLLATCVFFAICTEMLPVGLLPEIGTGLGVATSAAGILVSLYAVVVAVMSVPLAAFTERWPRRTVLAVLLGSYALSNLIFAASPNFAVAVVARVIGGAAHAGFFAVALAAAVDLVNPTQAGRAIAIVMAGNAVALLFGVPLGTTIGTALGWRWAFAAVAVALAALAVAVVRVLPAGHAPSVRKRTSVMDGIRRPAVLLMSAVVTLAALGHFTLYTYVSPLLLHVGVAASDVGAVLLAYGAGGVVGLVATGWIVGRRPGTALAIDVALMLLSLVLAATTGSVSGIIAVVALWGAAFGAFPTLTQTVVLRAAGDATSAATSLVNATTNIGIAGGAFIGSRLLGQLSAPGLGWVGAALVAVALLLYAVSVLGTRRTPSAR